MAVNKKLVVIDGKSVFYRGYYAMPNLASSDGTPTGGVYGFAVMALEVIKKFNPDYVAVAWDKPKTNIRRRVEIYPEYKANRKPAPPDFYVQIPVLHELLDALKWPLFEIDDHEADDIMATLARQAHEKGVDTLLITSDHDVLQLVNDHTKVALLKKGLTNIEILGDDELEAKYDLSAQQFVDYKALKGDPSDNVPGVAGVGDKTAVKLIKDYRSLDGVYQNLDKIKGSLHDKLMKSKDMAYLTRELVILDEEVPVELDLKQAELDIDAPKLINLLNKLEFRTLIKQLPEDMAQAVEEVRHNKEHVKEAEVILVYTQDDVSKIQLTDAKSLVVHARYAGEDYTDMSHFLISAEPQKAFLIDFSGQLEAGPVLSGLKPLMSAKLIGHDVKSVIRGLLQLGIDVGDIEHDTQVAAFLANSLRRELDLTALARDELGYEGQNLEDLPPIDVQAAAAKISAIIWSLYDKQRLDLTALKLNDLADKIDYPMVPVLARMEHRGIMLDTEQLARMSDELDDQISDIQQQIYGHAGQEFNIASPAQLADILFEDLGLPTQNIKRGKTGFSTAASELDKLRGLHPIINLISDYREYSKLKNTYVDTLPNLIGSDGRLHTRFSQVTTQTGRLSSSDPNLQNIPVRTELGRRIRTAFTAQSGHVFVSADYSQFELRLAAVLAEDDDMIEAFNGGLDIHTRTAAQVYGVAMDDVTKNQRRDAKVINFGVLYGMSPHGLSMATGMSREDAQSFIKRYFELREPLLNYIDKLRKQAEDKGYVETMFGRRRPTPDVKSSNFAVREAAYRQAVNMPIQGTAADIMKMAMIKLEDELRGEAQQLLQIHDSILVETPEWKARKVAKIMKETMETIHKLPVALDVDVDIGQNWGEL